MRLGECLEDHQETWLERLLLKSRNLNWCVKAYCTTCGCQYFRSHLVELLSREIGFNLPNKKHPFLSDTSSNDMVLCFKEIVRACEQLEKSNLDGHDYEALEVILIDLSAMRLDYFAYSAQPYMDVVDGTWVGEQFAKMEEAAAERAERRRRNSEETAALAALAAERRKEREKRRKEHEEHNSRLEERRLEEYNSPERVEERRLEEQAKFEHQLATENFLDDYSQCDERGKLSKLENEDFIPLGAIPSELIPLDPQIVSSLSRESMPSHPCSFFVGVLVARFVIFFASDDLDFILAFIYPSNHLYKDEMLFQG